VNASGSATGGATGCIVVVVVVAGDVVVVVVVVSGTGGSASPGGTGGSVLSRAPPFATRTFTRGLAERCPSRMVASTRSVRCPFATVFVSQAISNGALVSTPMSWPPALNATDATSPSIAAVTTTMPCTVVDGAGDVMAILGARAGRIAPAADAESKTTAATPPATTR
jgi:hypothetical protein